MRRSSAIFYAVYFFLCERACARAAVEGGRARLAAVLIFRLFSLMQEDGTFQKKGMEDFVVLRGEWGGGQGIAARYREGFG